jgi:flagellar basal-body rod protein FlgC
MASSLSIPLSGMTAAATRLDVAASNIANELTAGPLPAAGTTTTGGNTAGASTAFSAYQALTVNQVDTSTGSGPAGTRANVSTVSPGVVTAYDPTAPFANQNGLVAMPNVDPVNEVVQLAIAKYTFTANVDVAKTTTQMQKSLLDIKS